MEAREKVAEFRRRHAEAAVGKVPVGVLEALAGTARSCTTSPGKPGCRVLAWGALHPASPALGAGEAASLLVGG